jgi:tRNA A-37 threonylcarbamoyl transferase component Bud32
VFEAPGGVTGVRRIESPAFWPAALPEWLEVDPPEASPLKSDGRVIRTRLPGHAADVVLKRYEAAATGRLPRAVRAFRKAVWLEHRGIEAPAPLLALAGPDGASLLVSAYVDGGVDLHTLLLEAGQGLSRTERAALADRLGRFLRGMHDAEISHRDLKAPNLLVAGEPPRIVIVDVDGVARRVVDWRRRARDLARLDASVDAHATDRARVLRAYWRGGPRPSVDRHTFARWIARIVARKRGPSGRPR